MLYIHIPFCHQKCTYCAFYSIPSLQQMESYVDALCQELILRKKESIRPLQTIYFGGGTPSILPLPLLHKIITTIQQHYDCSQTQEITLEANPEDLSLDYLTQLYHTQLYHTHFINRLSIGIQSFHNHHLKTLNRRHSSAQAIQAIQSAHQLGFHNISIDLIYGLPNQTLTEWQQNLAQLSNLEPYITHLSSYALSVEPGTMLHKQISTHHIQLPTEEEVMLQYQSLQQWITQHHWQQYEISSYCRNNHQSKHNSRYWNRTPYIGIGAAAHSFDGAHRRWNISNVNQYIQSQHKHTPFYEIETLTSADAYNEYLMTALRTTAGIDTNYLKTTWPQYTQTFQNAIAKYIQHGLLQYDQHLLKPTPQGLLQADGIASDLFQL